jgi:hypothetical protein
MSDIDKTDDIDLGSDDSEEFDPFADEDELEDESADEVTPETAEEPAPTPQTPEPQEKPPAQVPAPAPKPKQEAMPPASANPLAAAIDTAETKDLEKAKQSIYELLPIFEFAGASENIEDSAQTFEELRIAKAVDFPELEDGKRVSWTVEYGKITKPVSDAKGTSIAKMKTDIEQSKEFLDALKKAKDKTPSCKIKPRVTAQSKGTAKNAAYKGVFANLEEVDAANKTISILPAKDGKVYEIRNNDLGRFITPVVGCKMLSDVRAGFIPASGIPPIPMNLTMRILAFFRYFTQRGADREVLVNIYWDKHGKEFVVDTPTQIVSRVSVDSTENPDYISDRYIHYMDIHSHNSMRAFFSSVDDADEKATRLYTVIGRLDKFFPEIRTRISNGGKFHEIDPSEVFEYIARPYPDDWTDKITFREPHKDAENFDAACAGKFQCFDLHENADDFL